jgi:hypothetical protein
MRNTTYYKIQDLNLVGKIERTNKPTGPHLFKGGKWVIDNENAIMDRVMGYDEYEPSDSPYKMGCADMLERIEEITEAEAMDLIGG